MSNDIKMPISAVELQEFLFAETATVAAMQKNDNGTITTNKVRDHIRESFRFQRFAVMNWLMMNGVAIPSHLLSDQAHPPVGSQQPDKHVDARLR